MATVRPDTTFPIADIKNPYPVPKIVTTHPEFPLSPLQTTTHASDKNGSPKRDSSTDQPSSVRPDEDTHYCIQLPDYDSAQATTLSAEPTSKDSRCHSTPQKEEAKTNDVLAPKDSYTLPVPVRYSVKFSFESGRSWLDVRQLGEETETPGVVVHDEAETLEEAVVDNKPNREVVVTEGDKQAGPSSEEETDTVRQEGTKTVREIEAENVREEDTQVQKNRGTVAWTITSTRPVNDRDRIERCRRQVKDDNEVAARDKTQGRESEDSGVFVAVDRRRTGGGMFPKLCRGVRKGARRCWAVLNNKGRKHASGR